MECLCQLSSGAQTTSLNGQVRLSRIGISDCDVSNCCWEDPFGLRSNEKRNPALLKTTHRVDIPDEELSLPDYVTQRS